MNGADPVRTAILRMAASVSVLTVDDGVSAHGATVSSTSVVSRRPPMVCAGLRTGSALTEMVRRREEFVVNVLAAAQAPLAEWFADPERPRGLAQFDRARWDPHPQAGAPVLRGVAAALACRLRQVIPVGDHDLLVAEVIEARAGTGLPLLTFAGGLHRAELHDLPRRQGPARRPALATSLD